MGILQMASLSEEFNEKVRKSRYLRTPSRETPSEAAVMYYLRRTTSYAEQLRFANNRDNSQQTEETIRHQVEENGIIPPGNTGFTTIFILG